MKNKTTSILIILLLAVGAWFVVAGMHDSHDHDHPHHDHDHDTHHDGDHDDHETLGTLEAITADEPVRADGTFSIATSFYPLAFVLERLTDGVAEVTNIGAGRDPHDVQLSAQNIATMQQADLVVIQGAGLEPWGETMLGQLAIAAVPTLVASHELTLLDNEHEDHDEHEAEHDGHDEEDHDEHAHEAEAHDDHHDHDHGAFDPHTWLDPVLFSQSVSTIVEALVILDPDNATLYETRGAALTAELQALDTAYKTHLTSCAATEVITSHDAFGYLGERYGFTIHAIAGLSTQDLPSAQTLATLRDEAAEGVSAILLEQNSIAAYGHTLAAETGLRTLEINPIAYLIPAGDDYLSLMQNNLDTFADALQCS